MPLPSVVRAVRRALPVALPLVFACGEEKSFDPSTLPTQSALYWDLNLNHHAVTLSTTAPYDTLTVVATPRNIDGGPIAGLPVAKLVSADASLVLVTPDGRLVAMGPMAPGTHVTVTATLTAGNLKHTDSLLVRTVVDPDPPVLTTFSIQPVAPDSAKTAGIRDGADPIIQRKIPLVATDENGAPMTDLLVSYRSSDPKVAIMSSWSPDMLEGYVPGRVRIYAQATAFGVNKADTLPYRVGLPISGRFVVNARKDGIPGSRLQERQLRLGIGAVVIWQATAADTTRDLDVTFTDPTHVAEFTTASPVYPYATFPAVFCEFLSATDCTNPGNIMLHRVFNEWSGMTTLTLGARTFPVPGVYDFHSTLQGFDGRIIVVDESEE